MIDFARRLVATASPSGDEGAVIELCAAEMERLGYDLSRDPEGNLLGTVGRGDSRLLFDVHADTVAPTAQGATIADGCLFGRGACDVKGPMPALIHGVADAHRAGTLGAQVELERARRQFAALASIASR